MGSEASKFNPEFDFLENPRILELDNLINEIINFDTSPEEKQRLIGDFERKWNEAEEEYIKEAETDDTYIKDFLHFVSYNLRKMSIGGMNMGRSWIGDFIGRKASELTPYFDRFGGMKDEV